MVLASGEGPELCTDMWRALHERWNKHAHSSLPAS